MEIPARTTTQLAVEGIFHVEDLEDFEDEDLKMVTENFKYPPQIPDLENAEKLTRMEPYMLDSKPL